MPPSCHACEQPSTRQHARAATGAETQAHLAALRQATARAAEGKRLQLRLQIASLEHAIATLPPTLSGADRRALTGRARTQIAALQAEHDAVSAPADLDHHLPVTVAVFTCDEHAPDAERAALLHAATCDPAAEHCCEVAP